MREGNDVTTSTMYEEDDTNGATMRSCDRDRVCRSRALQVYLSIFKRHGGSEK